MNNIDETELARLEALAAKASRGPYRAFENSLRDLNDHQIAEITQDHDDFTQDIHDTAYIAAACNAVPALVAEVRRLREDRAAMLSDMDAVKTKAEPCDDCWTIYMLMREMGIEEKNWFHRDVCARLKAMQNAEEENAALLEKVEAWEWYGECLDLWNNSQLMTERARLELWLIRRAAREGVHADRE